MLSGGQCPKERAQGTLGSLQYGELKNYTLNLNAYKCKERSGEKNNEKQR